MLVFILNFSTSIDMCSHFQTKVIGEGNGELSGLCSSVCHTFTVQNPGY